MSKDTGGPAFPRHASWSPSGEGYDCGDIGMSLRDYFAAQVISACAEYHSIEAKFSNHANAAAAAYAIADAMLAERAKDNAP